MQVVFTKTGEKRYGVAVEPRGHPRLTMSPAPGFDPFLPHDLAHFVVESEFGLRLGIYGQLAAGGDAGTFRSGDPDIARKSSRRSDRLGTADAPTPPAPSSWPIFASPPGSSDPDDGRSCRPPSRSSERVSRLRTSIGCARGSTSCRGAGKHWASVSRSR